MTAFDLAPASVSERALVAEIAASMIWQTAPEEADLFPETAAEYFADPNRTLVPADSDQAVGFGLDLAMLTPYALAVASGVVQFLMSTLAQVAQEESRAALGNYVRRLFRRFHSNPANSAAPEPRVGDPDSEPTLSPEMVRRVRDVAFTRAEAVGLDAERAGLLADAVAGGLSVGA